MKLSERRKRVLIITYYWPPSGGAGVQRWLKFTKYLRDYGWEPVIYTPENPESPATDESLLKEIPEGVKVIKRKIWEPYRLYTKLLGKKKTDHSTYLPGKGKGSLMQRLSVWVRGNVFIPDPRKYWIKPSIRKLKKHLRKEPVDAIVSTGPPHSMHLIALGIKKKLNIPWLADFRDPWTFIDFYDQLNLSKKADRKHKRLEKAVLENADQLVTVTWSWGDMFEKLAPVKFEVIPNGYDPADFDFGDIQPENEFTLNHIGSLNADRNPHVLWDALKELCSSNEEFKKDLKIKLIGKCNPAVFDSIDKAELKDNLEHVEYMSHEEVLKTLPAAQMLLLLINNTPNVKGIIPGKLYEYMAAKRPILCIGFPDGDSARVINETSAGVVVEFSDLQKMKEVLLSKYQDFKRNQLSVDSDGVDKYSRKKQAGSIAALLDKITG